MAGVFKAEEDCLKRSQTDTGGTLYRTGTGKAVKDRSFQGERRRMEESGMRVSGGSD